ncbi:tyrosine-type recombinase/integrase [Blastomonas sp. SL216]|uniref:tyrosine-type recombinase/integrase n=1 Tax=Blastomonas sp. SL216 TaxID=2995169 RepID=UPI0023775573|nr:tyrosine-type recombinase/integrase [Blastomonas sp. SL216]
MANAIRHVTKRQGVYQYVRRVPQQVVDRPAEFEALFGGITPFRRSLRTKDQADALIAAHEVELDFERRVQQALGKALMTAPQRRLTSNLLQAIRAEQKSLVTRPYRLHIIHREQDAAHHAEVERMFEQFETDAEGIRRVLIDMEPTDDPRLDAASIADRIIAHEAICAPVGSSERSFIIKAVREGLIDGYREIGDLMSGKQSVLPAADEGKRTKQPRLSEIVMKHVDVVPSRRTKGEIKTALRDFVAHVGDLPIDELTKAHVRSFCEHQGSKTIGGRSRNSIARPMSSANLDKKVGLLRAAVNRFAQQSGFEGPNPFAGIKASVFTMPQSAEIMPDKRPFELEELNRVFAYPWFTGCASPENIHSPGDHRLTGMHYWVPVVALMTGCRAGELGGLMLDEVRLDDRFPHIVIRDNKFRSTKKRYQRKVPLLDQLIELGFPAFVSRARARGDERLFQDWIAPGGPEHECSAAWSNSAVIRSFNQTLIPTALEGLLVEGARRAVTFHGFRGAFKTLLTRNKYGIQPNYVHEVVGHEKSNLDARYIGEIPLAETYPAIRACRYEGLVLPRPK